MNRRNFIIGLALAPVLVREVLSEETPRYICTYDPVSDNGGGACCFSFVKYDPEIKEYVVEVRHEYGVQKVFANYPDGRQVHVADVRGE